MELEGQRKIENNPNCVWEALVDPNVLQECIPGSKSMIGDPDSGFEAVLVEKVGPVKATFKCQIDLTDNVPGQSCTISGQGKGGPAGFAKGEAKIVLEEFQGGTLLSYKSQARVGGKIAQLGSRIIDGFAKKVAEEFFANFQESIDNPDQDSRAASDAQESADNIETSPDGKKVSWHEKAWNWVRFRFGDSK